MTKFLCEVPTISDPRVLRKVAVDEHHVLVTWDPNKRDGSGRDVIGYALMREGVTIFCAEDVGASPAYEIDSDESLRSIVRFLTYGVGDVDAEYFAEYSDEQIAWRDEYAERLSPWGIETREMVNLPHDSLG